MSTKYKIPDQEALYFISFATVEWMDEIESIIDNKGIPVTGQRPVSMVFFV